MLLELAKPVALLLCLLSLCALFHTAFLIPSDIHLLLQPNQALRDRVIDSLLLLAFFAGICIASGLLFQEATPSHPSLSATLPLQIFFWAVVTMVPLFFLSWFLEAHYIFTPSIHW
jgi:hypothetical protein